MVKEKFTKVIKMDEISSINNILSIEEVKSQIQVIQNLMKEVMREGEHYGLIPGCGDKPTLLKAGAEKLAFVFRLRPQFEVKQIDYNNGHREYQIICTLYSIITGNIVGQGVGCCSTMEGKYRYRNMKRICTECGKETVIKGKSEYGGGWICYKNIGGCGAKWKDGDEIIENQEVGKVEYENPADYYNTCLKIAKKRGLVDGIITTLAASDIFTQDIEDYNYIDKEIPSTSSFQILSKLTTPVERQLKALRQAIHIQLTQKQISDADYRKYLKDNFNVNSSTEITSVDTLKHILNYYINVGKEKILSETKTNEKISIQDN